MANDSITLISSVNGESFGIVESDIIYCITRGSTVDVIYDNTGAKQRVINVTETISAIKALSGVLLNVKSNDIEYLINVEKVDSVVDNDSNGDGSVDSAKAIYDDGSASLKPMFITEANGNSTTNATTLITEINLL